MLNDNEDGFNGNTGISVAHLPHSSSFYDLAKLQAKPMLAFNAMIHIPYNTLYFLGIDLETIMKGILIVHFIVYRQGYD